MHASDKIEERLLIPTRDAAAMLSISPRKLHALTKSGDVPHMRIDRRVLYSVAALERWVQGRIQGVGRTKESDSF